MEPSAELPSGLVHVRTTEVFDDRRHPAGLLRAHRVAEHVWARLVVRSGRLGFVFDDSPDARLTVAAGEAIVIPPVRPHHIVFDGPVEFVLEFYRRPGIGPLEPGHESSGAGSLRGRSAAAGGAPGEVAPHRGSGSTSGVVGCDRDQ